MLKDLQLERNLLSKKYVQRSTRYLSPHISSYKIDTFRIFSCSRTCLNALALFFTNLGSAQKYTFDIGMSSLIQTSRWGKNSDANGNSNCHLQLEHPALKSALGKTYPKKTYTLKYTIFETEIVEFFGGGIFKTVSDCKLFCSKTAILQILCAIPIFV